MEPGVILQAKAYHENKKGVRVLCSLEFHSSCRDCGGGLCF